MNTPILQVRKKRKEILLILATAILLAVAIDFAASYFSVVFSDHPIGLVAISVPCLLAGALLLKKIVFGATGHIFRLRGAVAFSLHDETLETIKIVGYPFNDDFCRFLRSFVHENKAYLKLLSQRDTDTISMERFDPDNLNHHTIVNSVAEFILLNKLHHHLNGYFIENEIDRSNIVVLTRDQIGPDVLKNRVIDQLTKDRKERPGFDPAVDEGSEVRRAEVVRYPIGADPSSDTDGVVVYSEILGGPVYQRLELELPPNSTITRNRYGYLVIANPLFDLTLMPKYKGFHTTLASVLTPSQDASFAPFLVSLEIHIRVKSKALLTNESMEMYEWLDSLIEKMQDYFSVDRLEQRLNVDLLELLASSRRSEADD